MKKLVAVLVAFLVAATVVSMVWVTTRPSASEKAEELEPTGESAPAGLEKFYDQQVTWKDCEENLCAQIQVPTNYDKPDGEVTKLSMKRIPATGGGTGKVLFVNPGGPGGSAQEYAESFAASTSDKVLATYDIVGVDPRGVGESSPLECLSDAKFDEFVATNPAPTTDAGAQELSQGVIAMGKACASNSGELAGHVSTRDVARDQDIVRAALGQDRFYWFGASYGTALGATYADLFPEKVERMVLDAAVDVTLDSTQLNLGQAQGFQRALESYASWCAKSKCALGSTQDEVIDSIQRAVDQAAKDPLKGDDGRLLNTGWIFYGLITPLYAEVNWPYMTQAVEGALDGDPTTLFSLADIYFDREGGTYTTNGGQVIYAVNCLDDGVRGSIDAAKVRDELVPQFTKISPLFGEVMAWGAVSCLDWPLPAVTPQEPVKAAGAKPIVVVGTTRDPATPYEWSKNMASQLESGVLLSRDGDGHTAYQSDNICIDKAIESYLLNGTVPADGTMCQANAD